MTSASENLPCLSAFGCFGAVVRVLWSKGSKEKSKQNTGEIEGQLPGEPLGEVAHEVADELAAAEELTDVVRHLDLVCDRDLGCTATLSSVVHLFGGWKTSIAAGVDRDFRYKCIKQELGHVSIVIDQCNSRAREVFDELKATCLPPEKGGRAHGDLLVGVQLFAFGPHIRWRNERAERFKYDHCWSMLRISNTFYIIDTVRILSGVPRDREKTPLVRRVADIGEFLTDLSIFLFDHESNMWSAKHKEAFRRMFHHDCETMQMGEDHVPFVSFVHTKIDHQAVQKRLAARRDDRLRSGCFPIVAIIHYRLDRVVDSVVASMWSSGAWSRLPMLDQDALEQEADSAFSLYDEETRKTDYHWV